MARPRPPVPPMTASLFDERSSRSIEVGRRVTLGSGTPFLGEVRLLGALESLGADFFDAFTDTSFPSWVRREGSRCRRRPIDRWSSTDHWCTTTHMWWV